MKKFLISSVALLAIAGNAANAYAYTWEVERCAQLYVKRNSFYNRKGLCFTRPTALEFFPNNPYTCRYQSSENFPISANEKRWVDAIVAEERAIGCPRI